MTAKEVKRATDNLSCPVCFQVFKNPKYLPCYHSYCEGCLEKMQVQSKITCPECRQEATIPTGGVKDLQNNFLISRLVDELVLKHKVEGEDEVQCELCDEDDPVVTFCPDCSMFLCHVCNEAHKRDKRSRGHCIVLLTELRSKKDVPVQPKPKAPMCKKHEIELSFYCETCAELVCMYCTVKDHAGHEHDSVKLMASKHRDELKKVTAPVDEMMKSLSKAHDNIEKIQMEIKKQGDITAKKIDAHYDELVKKLLEQKEQMKERAYDAASHGTKVMMAQLEEVEHVQAEVSNMKDLKDAVENSSDQELLSAKKQVVDQMHQLFTIYQKVNIKPLQPPAVEYAPSNKPFPQFGVVLNAPLTFEVQLPKYAVADKLTEVKIITKDSNGHCCSVRSGKMSIQLESSNGDVTVVQVRDNNDGSHAALFVAPRVAEMKLLVNVNGKHIEGSPFLISVRGYPVSDEISKVVDDIGNDDNMGEPWGIAFGNNGIWAVTDTTNHCVYVFNQQDKLMRKFGVGGTRNSQFNRPYKIDFDDGNHLYVADHNNHRIQKFDISGNYLMTIGSKGSRDGQLSGPVGVTVHNDSLRVYVSEANNKRISVFEMFNGQFCFTITKPLNKPYDVVVSKTGQLLVADYGNYCIYTFTLEGHFINKFGTEGNGQLREPCSLTVDRNNYILVTDTAHHRITVFDSDGNYMHCFGSEGIASGQLNRPRGIAVRFDGRIYVSDSWNRRVQIYFVFTSSPQF
ncbi:E3 ubiquitin-protein ligase TRIM71-like [Dysidea avara]|uniref:E3 ubiquitin-protein ligase TRIM71-like n=1 Tax=Dysidea avara TaxID=196820 RepID=UPI00332CD29A